MTALLPILCYCRKKFFGERMVDLSGVVTPFIRPGETVLVVGRAGRKFLRAIECAVGKNGYLFTALQEVKKRGSTRPVLLPRRIHVNSPGNSGTPEAIADLVICIRMTGVVPAEGELIQEIHAAMRPAGTLMICEPVWRIRKRQFNGMLSVAEEQGFIGRPGPAVPGYHTALMVRIC
ncbi:MAG: hypothetical protein JW863_11190 [Chitinispirillaceae bacterium]|nr:hypothetical protein [Chitinispirillaceae bacterium]